MELLQMIAAEFDGIVVRTEEPLHEFTPAIAAHPAVPLAGLVHADDDIESLVSQFDSQHWCAISNDFDPGMLDGRDWFLPPTAASVDVPTLLLDSGGTVVVVPWYDGDNWLVYSAGEQ